MSSITANMLTILARPSGLIGARLSEQLPITTVVIAVLDRRGCETVPADLRIEVRVDVDETGREDRAGAVDLLFAATGDPADLGDQSVCDGEVAFV